MIQFHTLADIAEVHNVMHGKEDGIAIVETTDRRLYLAVVINGQVHALTGTSVADLKQLAADYERIAGEVEKRHVAPQN